MAVQRQLRPELTFEAEPPPRRLAPLAYAVAATVLAEADTEIGWGKFVLLFDAAGPDLAGMGSIASLAMSGPSLSRR